jgi:uncharacterized glyoxalase superfamily protein PhnB
MAENEVQTTEPVKDTTPPLVGPVPYLVVKEGDGDKALDFYQAAFDAKLTHLVKDKDGKKIYHASMVINNGVLMLSEECPEYTKEGEVFKPRNPEALGGTSVTLHLHVRGRGFPAN